MRECFRTMDLESRKALYKKVLEVVGQDICVRNLCTDNATNLETMMAIIAYFKKHDCPPSKSDRDRISLITLWLRQGGAIRIEKPTLLMSVQRTQWVLITLRQHASDLSKAYFGSDLNDDPEGDVFLENLFVYQKEKQVNDLRYEKISEQIKKTRIRRDHERNIWVTWNEQNPNQPCDFSTHKNDKSYIFKSLGLGYDLENLEAHYVAFCFDSSRTKEMVLFRPGWGDATTYNYWESIKDENAPYGYTKPIGLQPEDKKPEAVAANEHFCVEMLTPHSFSV